MRRLTFASAKHRLQWCNDMAAFLKYMRKLETMQAAWRHLADNSRGRTFVWHAGAVVIGKRLLDYGFLDQ